MRYNLILWWGLKRSKNFFFNWHIFYYYKHIKMMSNMPYQMVYSNCQNKGWSMSNFPEKLLKNSRSAKWQKSATNSSIPHRYPWKSWEKKLLPKYWYVIYKGEETEGAFKLPSLKNKCPCTAQMCALKGKTRVSHVNSEKVYSLRRMTWQLSTSPHLSRTLRC